MVVKGPSRSCSERDADGLLLGVEIDRVVAALAPDAAVLHAAEGHSQVTLRYQSSSHHTTSAVKTTAALVCVEPKPHVMEKQTNDGSGGMP